MDFASPIPQHLLNIEHKNRSNLFAWRGQFSPQLIEYLLEAYCLADSVVLDPFVGSGTVLLEAARVGLPAYGFEINPSAWSFSKVYELSNLPPSFREEFVAELHGRIVDEFPIVIFAEPELAFGEVEERIVRVGSSISNEARILCSALVVLLDLHNNDITSDMIRNRFQSLAKLVRDLPYSTAPIKADLRDARELPLADQSVDFVITSPPYINVFNYHQNYRRSVELLGWDVLRVARSEIGSNRANRGNRFYTVVQYCIDMARTLQELARVLEPGGRAILIVGYKSTVLGVPFYNADLIQRIATESGIFKPVLRQKRVFKNRFGQPIREDILNFSRQFDTWQIDNREEKLCESLGQRIACDALRAGTRIVPEKNRALLYDALAKAQEIDGTVLFNGNSYTDYHTRDTVMMVEEDGNPTTYE